MIQFACYACLFHDIPFHNIKESDSRFQTTEKSFKKSNIPNITLIRDNEKSRIHAKSDLHPIHKDDKLAWLAVEKHEPNLGGSALLRQY